VPFRIVVGWLHNRTGGSVLEENPSAHGGNV
jgi:hypothetical protein